MSDRPHDRPPEAATVFRFFNEVAIIEQLARTQLERVLPDGLRQAQFGVLNHFVRLGGERSPVELARAFQVTKGAMTNTLQRLESRGFVTIRPDPHDGRAKRVAITEAGRAAHAKALEALAPVYRIFDGAVGAADFAAMLPLLERVRMVLDINRNPPLKPVDWS